jgi:hypothetical protein
MSAEVTCTNLISGTAHAIATSANAPHVCYATWLQKSEELNHSQVANKSLEEPLRWQHSCALHRTHTGTYKIQRIGLQIPLEGVSENLT